MPVSGFRVGVVTGEDAVSFGFGVFEAASFAGGSFRAFEGGLVCACGLLVDIRGWGGEDGGGDEEGEESCCGMDERG